MPTVKLSPLFNDQTVTSSGAPASGYKVYTYAAGSSTSLATYTDSSGTVPQSNPIVLNANGRADNSIWLQSGLSYKFILKDADEVQVGQPWDGISGVNDTSTTVSQWVSSGVTPTYVSVASFTLLGDQTTEFHAGRSVQCTVTAGTVYGVIISSAYTTLTTVTIQIESGTLDSGLSVVNLGILRADHTALPSVRYLQRVATTNSNYVGITGASAVIPFDDTIPQITEGSNIASRAITPKSASSTLEITVTIHVGMDGAGGSTVSAALFKDSGADAIAASAQFLAAGDFKTITIKHRIAAGAASSQTFSFRLGPSNSARTAYLNGTAAGRMFGGVMAASIVIDEVAP